jgi:hypothetical protein
MSLAAVSLVGRKNETIVVKVEKKLYQKRQKIHLRVGVELFYKWPAHRVGVQVQIFEFAGTRCLYTVYLLHELKVLQ